MRVVVAIKQIVDTSVPLVVAAEGRRLAEDGLERDMNAVDRAALELALGLVRAAGEGTVTAVSVGPPRVERVLRASVALGAARALRVDDPDPPAHRPLRVARQIAAAAEVAGFDLVVCGGESADTADAQVAGALGELLGVPQVTRAVGLRPGGNGEIVVERMAGGGEREVVALGLPAVVAVEPGAGTDAAYASLPALIESLRVPIDVVRAPAENGEEAARSPELVALGPPRPRQRKIVAPSSQLSAHERIRALMRGGMTRTQGTGSGERGTVEGSPEELARRAVSFLRERGAVPERG